MLLTCGAFTPEGDFLELPEFDMDRLLAAWQDAVFELYLAKEKIEPEVMENIRGHQGHPQTSMAWSSIWMPPSGPTPSVPQIKPTSPGN